MPRSSASSPARARMVNSRGWICRPWKKRTGPETSSVSPLRMVRSRNGWPGHEHSISPLESLITAWKKRSPRRVGITPFETTSPIAVASTPGASRAIDVTVVASR